MRAEWVKSVARALCKCAGSDPDDVVLGETYTGSQPQWTFFEEEAAHAIAAVAPLIAAAERERCARVAMECPIPDDGHVTTDHARVMQGLAIAAAIRALGENGR